MTSTPRNHRSRDHTGVRAHHRVTGGGVSLALAGLAAVSVLASPAHAVQSLTASAVTGTSARTAVESSPPAHSAVPPDFVAASTSWQTSNSGWVLGFHPCSVADRLAPSCPTLVHTTDGGASWRAKAAPGVRVSPRFRQVKVVFAGPAEGLATDGTRLFVTRDGARTWQRASFGQAVSVGDIGFTGTSAYAIIGTGTTDDGTTALYASPRDGHGWTAVPNVHTAGNGINVDGGYDLATKADVGAVALGRIFVDTGYWTTTDGTTWRKRPAPCTSDQLPSFNWVGARGLQVVATCSYNPGMSREFKDVRQSLGGGDFTTFTSAPDDLFTTSTSAATPTSPFIGATGAGVGWLYGTFDQGSTWKTVLEVDDELPFYDLQFTDPQHGYVVSGGSAYARGAVYTTADGGRTWQPLDLG